MYFYLYLEGMASLQVLRRALAEAFFALLAKKKAYQAVFGQF